LTDNTETNWRLDEQLLEESLEDLYEHAPCGYVSTLPDGTFAKVNQTFLGWIGYPREELLAGKRFQDLLTVGGKIFFETHYAPLLRMQGFVNEIAFDLVCRDGRRLPVLINSVQKRDVSGTPFLNRTTIFDASDRRKYERELQLARKAAEEALHLRDQFLALASHELKTPLTSVLGNIQLLQRRVNKENTLSARDQRTLQIIADQMNRLNKMVHSLLDISRIEGGQLSIERGRVDVCALVSRVVDEAQPTLGGRTIEMQSSIRSAVIQGDELRLEQVFQNLIQNALKYSAPTTPIYVAVRQDAARVCVEVHDQGIGIPQAALPHLFDRFYRAANVQEGLVGGIGIGLFVVKEIVELHGGHVTVESIEGQGSTFTVYLPLASA
jgi:PAS domain S-box-containing protein